MKQSLLVVDAGISSAETAKRRQGKVEDGELVREDMEINRARHLYGLEPIMSIGVVKLITPWPALTNRSRFLVVS